MCFWCVFVDFSHVLRSVVLSCIVNVVANWWTVQQSETSDCIGETPNCIGETYDCITGMYWTVKDGSVVAGQWALFNCIELC